MIYEKAPFCTWCRLEPLGTLCDNHAVGVWLTCSVRLNCRRLGRFGDTIRWVGIETVARMGRSGDTMFCGLACVLHTDAGQCRSGRSAIPCGGCAGCSGDYPAGLPAVRTPSAIPSVWVGVHPKLCWTLRAAKHLTCLRDAPGDSLLAFGLLLVWVSGWGWLWFRP